MFTGILTVCCLYSLYASAVHATDSHFDSATHTGQSCNGQFVLTPSRSVILASVVRNTRWRVPVKTKSTGLSLTYMSLLLVTISTEIELNPGPTSFPCGSCGLEVLENDPAISCDDCQQWFHTHCQDISLDTYQALHAEDVSFVWSCLKCDQTNYSTVKASLTFKCMTKQLFADFSYSIALDTYL